MDALDRMNPTTRVAVGVSSLLVGIPAALVMAALTAVSALGLVLGAEAGEERSLTPWVVVTFASFALGWLSTASLIAGGTGFLVGRQRALHWWKVGAVATGVVCGMMAFALYWASMFAF